MAQAQHFMTVEQWQQMFADEAVAASKEYSHCTYQPMTAVRSKAGRFLSLSDINRGSAGHTNLKEVSL